MKKIYLCKDCGEQKKSKKGLYCRPCSLKHKTRRKGLIYNIKVINKGWVKKGQRLSPETEFGNKPSWNKGTKGVIKPNSGSFTKGQIPWNKGILYDQIKWDKHPQFKDGHTRYRYFYERECDNRICDRCGIELDMNSHKTHIHHIDKDRTNNQLENLMLLCSKCHAHEHKNWEKQNGK